jgi:LysM repeat protein
LFRNINLCYILLISALLVSCRASKPLLTPSSINGSATEYIKSYKDLAISEMRRTGVPASITLAQGMLESDYGRSSLARIGNNHFGIKCHNDWTGQTIRQHDDRRNECFRKYRRPEDSFYDHSDFLKEGSRYRFLFDLDPLDYKAWARGLKRAGYATNPDYANLLIRKIEENSLYNFDRAYTASSSEPQEKVGPKEVTVSSGKSSAEPPITGNTEPPEIQQGAITFGDVMARAPRIMENNRIQYIIVKDGETREKLEKDFQMLKWELPRFNDLDDNFTPVPGQILYLEPKKDKAEAGIEYHTVVEGETMHMISQKYGIKLKSLLEMNRMEEGNEPSTGQKIWLQSIKPPN